jgi:hypothetical protein
LFTKTSNFPYFATKSLTKDLMEAYEARSKVIASTTNNLPNQADQASAEFDKRVKIAELMLKESDIRNKSKIVEMQMADKASAQSQVKQDFLSKLTDGLKQNG